MNIDALSREIKFDERGLVPCIAQDSGTGEILMLAYMSPESFRVTVEEGRACYFSRSRNKLWRKGEESGNFQVVKEILCDCDGDTLLLKVEQRGGCACHKGYRSCFFRRIEGETWNLTGDKVRNPEDMYSK